MRPTPGVSSRHYAHGMCTVNKDQINADLMAFIKAPVRETITH